MEEPIISLVTSTIQSLESCSLLQSWYIQTLGWEVLPVKLTSCYFNHDNMRFMFQSLRLKQIFQIFHPLNLQTSVSNAAELLCIHLLFHLILHTSQQQSTSPFLCPTPFLFYTATNLVEEIFLITLQETTNTGYYFLINQSSTQSFLWSEPD